MGARAIKRTKLSGQLAAYRNLRKRMASKPGAVTVTVIQNETTKAVVGVAISRDVAIKMLKRVEDAEHCELIDFAIEG